MRGQLKLSLAGRERQNLSFVITPSQWSNHK
jgi:hypothetical protein